MVGSVVWLHILLGPYSCVCGALFGMSLFPDSAPLTYQYGPNRFAATPPNQPQRCMLTVYFNNYNFSKAQIIRSLMIVIEMKHVGAVLIYILISF